MMLERSTTVRGGGRNLEPVQSQPSRCYALMSQRAVFILHHVVLNFLLSAQFPLNFLFLGITSQSSVLMARVYWKIENVSG